ncbi:MAG: IS200/IS605 family transposase [Saprospiraceae bacterium]
MPQSLSKIYIHIIFSTKLRQPLIDKDIKDELFDYIGGICRQLECIPLRVGGQSNHIHILCLLAKKIALVKLLEDIKRSSSKWIKTKGAQYSNFGWQDGYAAFSVSPSEIEHVIKYISNQDEHHKKRTFEEECRVFFERNSMKYDERFVWD